MNKLTLFLVAISCLMLGLFLGQAGLSYSNISNIFYSKNTEYSLPKIIVTQEVSNNKEYKAFILSEETSKNFYFAIQKDKNPRIILDSEFVLSSSYHAPIFKLAWDGNNKRVFISVDQDFGDNIKKFVYDVANTTFKAVN